VSQEKRILTPHNVFATAVGVQAEREADVGRVVAGDGAAGFFERDLRGWRGGFLACRRGFVERAPAVVERGALVALEAVRLLVGHAAALDGVERQVECAHDSHTVHNHSF